jgi:hypothetical protein
MANTRIYTIDGDDVRIRRIGGGCWETNKAELEDWADKSYEYLGEEFEVCGPTMYAIFKKLGIKKIKSTPEHYVKRDRPENPQTSKKKWFVSYREDCSMLGVKPERRLYKILGGEEIC